jgi:regulator of PEP synthase PpsR (kinase-PPPase family)
MTTTTTNNESIGSRYLANYIRNVQQANEGTAAQYEYRLSKFEKYVVTASEEERQQERQQQQNQELITLDHLVNELKKNGNNNKIDPYDLLSGFVAYLEEEEGEKQQKFLSLLYPLDIIYDDIKRHTHTIALVHDVGRCTSLLSQRLRCKCSIYWRAHGS